MLTYEKAHELFEIRDDGELIRKVSTSNNIKKGNIAGWIDKDCRKIKINGKEYKAHRIIWLMVHGKFPIHCITHINENKLDNRISNLSEGTNRSQTKPSVNNKSGFLGVSWDKEKQKFRSQIFINKKIKYLGLFDTPEQAHDAYLKAKRKIHEFCTI